jgi:hypothetical protein
MDRVVALEKRVDELSSLVVKLGVSLLQTNAPLDCNGHAAAPVRVHDGALIVFVSCLKIEPYLEGHKVTLKFGNPYSAQFSGFSGSLFYGGGTERFGAAEFSSPNEVGGGRWVEHSVIINPSDPGQMRELALMKFEMGAIRLLDSSR